jgi:RNA polymerase sigma-32 factor
VPRAKKSETSANAAKPAPRATKTPGVKTAAKTAAKAPPAATKKAAAGAAAAPATKRARAKSPTSEDGEEPHDAAESTDAAGADDGEETAEAGERDEADVSEPVDGDIDFADDAEELADIDEPDGGDGAPRPKRAAAKRATGSDDRGGAITGFDPMAAYLREVQRHPLLTPEQTHEIAVQFVGSQSPALAAKLVTSNLRLVVKIAYEYRRAYKNIMDLVQEGNIGLMQAVKRYDPYRNVKLSSYAAWWIRAYILRFILNNWRLVKLGTTQAQRKLFFNLRKKRAELAALGIDPTHEEIAKSLNVPEADVAEMDVRLSSNERSLDAPVGDAEGRSIARVDMMPSLSSGPETLVAGEELQVLLKDKLAEFRETLAGKEKDLAIFDERLVADDPLTLQELGDRFGISRERVRQLEQRLTGKLRDYLEQEMGDAAHVQ